MAEPPLTVVQSLKSWLPATQNWIYNHLSHLPEDIRWPVASERVENLDRFPADARALVPLGFPARVVNRRVPGVKRWRRRRLLDSVAQAAGADVLHSHFGDQACWDLPVARRRKLPHVVTFYGYDVLRLPRSSPAWARSYRKLFASVDRVTCEGPHMAQLVQNVGCPEDLIEVHHLGISLDDIPFAPRRYDGGTLRVLIAAAWREKKGITYGIEALANLVRDGVDVELTIIGDAIAAPDSIVEKRRIHEALDRTGMRARTRLLGFQPHEAMVKEAYRNHVFLSPSVIAADGDVEGGVPVGILEMAATGMPVVSTSHCDIPYVLRDRETGLLAPERDPEALTRRLEWLIHHPREWTRMAKAARADLEARFDVRDQAQNLARIYREVAA